MTRVRTLPIRLDPVDGEALDSWLEALAHRTDVQWRDVLAAVGLPPNRFGVFQALVAVKPEVAGSIASAAGITEDSIHAMTLARYQHIWLQSALPVGAENLRFPWGKLRGSRYCPQCLAETGGRWQLQWRLEWTFACTRHRCLLADICPNCAGPQRIRAFSAFFVPTPGLCGRSSDVPLLHRCEADLTRTVTPQLERGHPILQAQGIVDRILAGGASRFAIYGGRAEPCLYALSDIRQHAAHLLATEKAAVLQRTVEFEDLGVTCEPRNGRIEAARGHPGARDCWAASPHASVAALGITAAIHALNTRTEHAKALNVRRSRTTRLGAALASRLSPTDELRHRTPSGAIQCNTTVSSRIDNLVRRTPSMLWPAWALRFALPNVSPRHLRLALSVHLLLVDTPLRLADATKRLSGAVDEHSVGRILQLLSNRTDWPDTRTGLGRLSDYLADHDTPIDYQRRRQLDYTNLLPHQDWIRICRDTGSPAPVPAQSHVARCYLYERLSGLPLSAAFTPDVSSALRSQLADYPLRMSAERAEVVDRYCREFLASNNINDEPPFWTPPTEMFQGLRLPGPDPDRVDVQSLHRLLADTDDAPGRIAEKLGTTIDVARHLGERYPLPIQPPKTVEQARVRGFDRLKAKAALSPADFARMYHDERRSLRDIGRDVGVGHTTIANLAREYDIGVRSKRLPRRDIDREWLYQRYVTERQTLPDIAAECGMSITNMRVWARRHRIPMRPSGEPSHRAYLDGRAMFEIAPKWLRPALAGSGGWERLQLFAAATQYPTLTMAVAELGAPSLFFQKRRLEVDLGVPLIQRARRGRPMQLTKDGRKVLAAIRAMQATNHLPGRFNGGRSGPRGARKARRRTPDR